ncbi:MAG: mobile mystery protein A [Proteobacteria bacterium]|nr:mobile mystery protein A [Pseudomonadota bacterium]
MKRPKKAILNQRDLIEERLKSWAGVAQDRPPPTGWIKATRESLGMTARNLGERMGLDHAGVLRLEEREANGKATLELIERAARAMGCRVVYALVPEAPHQSLNDILDAQALKSARSLAGKVEHSMRLEKQGVERRVADHDIQKLAQELKEKLDPLLWGKKS